MENKQNKNVEGKLLIMQLLLEIEDLRFFVKEEFLTENGKDFSEEFSKNYLKAIEIFNKAQFFMEQNLKEKFFEFIDDSHHIFVDYQRVCVDKIGKKEDFYKRLDDIYIPKIDKTYNEIVELFKKMK